ncbi:MAG: peroxiredoxin-like family protein [Balneolaceae bacterium]|nr:peroxiredoxin-like family protein [Balneolaceae bacterium]
MKYSVLLFPLLVLSLLVSGCGEQRVAPADQPEYSAGERMESGHIADEAAGVQPVLTGTTMPDAMVRTAEGDSVTLMELVSDRPAVLVFYRGGWCPYCNKHMAELQQVEDKLVDMGYQILAISPDRPKYLQATGSEQELSYTLLSDSPLHATSAFGLAYKVDQETIDRYREGGLDLAERAGYNHYALPVPALFLVDTEGTILFQYVNPDYTTRINADVLMAAARAYLPGNEE